MKNIKFRKIALILLAVVFVAGLTALTLNEIVRLSAAKKIVAPDDATKFEGADCIIVLGCKVKEDGTPSDMLADRLERAVELYRAGVAPKILMSGDHGTEEYNEVLAMKQYAIDAGVPAEDVFCDHAGFSTYETMYRAKEIFGVEKAVVSTQKYHLYRALYVGSGLGIDCIGVPADYHTYRGQWVRECREIAGRCKDCLKLIFKPEPTYLGSQIPITGNGEQTW